MKRSRLLLPVLGSMIAVGVLFVGIFPTRAIIEQRQDLARAERRLEFLSERNAGLEQRIDALGTDAEIERLAREEYNLVYPGEEAYAILPAPPAAPTIPDAWPFRQLRASVVAPAAPSTP